MTKEEKDQIRKEKLDKFNKIQIEIRDELLDELIKNKEHVGFFGYYIDLLDKWGKYFYGSRTELMNSPQTYDTWKRIGEKEYYSLHKILKEDSFIIDKEDIIKYLIKNKYLQYKNEEMINDEDNVESLSDDVHILFSVYEKNRDYNTWENEWILEYAGIYREIFISIPLYEKIKADIKKAFKKKYC